MNLLPEHRGFRLRSVVGEEGTPLLVFFFFTVWSWMDIDYGTVPGSS